LQVLWSKKSQGDLESIFDHIALDRPEAAARHIVLIIQTVERLLSGNPAAGRAGRVTGTRELAVPGSKYIAAYRVRGGVVEVLCVIHCARKWPKRL